MIELILFDLDGVLINSAKDIYASTNYALKQLALPAKTMEEMASTFSMTSSKRFNTWVEDEEICKKAAQLYADYYMEEAYKQTEFYDNAKDIIINLAQTKKLGIISSKWSSIINKLFSYNDLTKYFDIIIGGDMVSVPKPSPEGILNALAKLGVEPENAIMIGDSDGDIFAGKNAGIKTCGVTYGLGDVNLLRKSNPDYLINDIAKLSEILDKSML